ncbi:MAG: hypothetical protein JWN08_2877 [Frankiales bacterium]|nr:hypothetical protein [Frankiales bacterium]
MRWHRLALLLALTGCSSAGECSLVGCVSQLTVTLPAGVTSGEACVAGVCTSQVVDGTLLVPLGRRADGDSAVVTVTLPGAAAPLTGQVPLLRSRPNGDRCPPVCVTGSAELDVAGQRVVAVRG